MNRTCTLLMRQGGKSVLLTFLAMVALLWQGVAQPLDLNPALKPFYHGVASGDPLSDRVIIWTRVTPEEDGEIAVAWTMATDPALTNVVKTGTFTTSAERDYTVKIDVEGLASGTTYYYQFEALEATSIIGRTRTAPEGSVDHLRLAVVSCSNYQAGYFNAYGKIAERADLDAVVHLGDYIYEYSATGEDFYGSDSLRDAGKRRHLPDKELLMLDDYRTRYSQYRLDPNLRRAHQQHPFITVWDDHESANDAYEDGAQNHQPDEGSWEDRKNVSRQAYTEWIPIRGDLNAMPLYRTIRYGDLMDLIMIDTRLEGRELQEMSVTDAELYDPERTILGAEQKEWLLNELSSSTAKWKVIGNQVIFSDLNVWWAGLNPASGFTPTSIESLFLDIWDGYPMERDQVIRYIGDNNIDDVVILTGDFHSSFAFDVALEPAPLTGQNPLIPTTQQVPFPVTPTYNPEDGAGSVAVEFATPSITAANFDENIGAQGSAGFEFQINKPLTAPGTPLDGINPNPHIRFNDLDQHGYFVLDVQEGRAQANWYYVEEILSVNDNESFGAAWGSDKGENHLTPGEENSPKENAPALAPDQDSDGNFTLQVLHASDLEGGVDAIENAPNFAAIIDALEDSVAATLVLSSGDNYIPGPFFGAAGDAALRPVLQSVYQDLFNEPALTNLREAPGRIDISIMNIIGFDASAFGNHEFDAGTSTVREIIATDIRGSALSDVRWLGAQFPYLSANLDFSGDENLSDLFTDQILVSDSFASQPDDLAAAQNAPKIAPATIVEVAGEQVGVVGATTQLLASITSNGGVEVIGPDANDMPALAAILQPFIDALESQGINKIILTTHLQQIALEKTLIGLLSGVDVVLAGGSDVLFAQDDDVLRTGDTKAEEYPFITQNADGEPAVIVGTDGEYSYVGRLLVEFDAEGVLIPASLSNPQSGAFATLPSVVGNLYGSADAFEMGSKAELVSRLTNAVDSIVNVQDGNVLGRTAVFLDGRRSQVRTEETNLGNLTADANLFIARQVDPSVQVSIKNGGGIRAAIGEIVDLGGGDVTFAPPQANPESGKQEGEVSQLDIVNSLRFNNSLTLLTLTAAELKQVVEHAVSATTPGATPGQFPQIGGMRFSFDTTQAPGSRVQTLDLINEQDAVISQIVRNGQVTGNPNRPIRIVTLNFLADGGDGYPFPALSENRVELTTALTNAGAATFASPGTEQDALAEYLVANFQQTPFDKAETPVTQDQRIINIQGAGLPTVLGFTLIDTQKGRDTEVQMLQDGDIVNIRALSLSNFNIRADVGGAGVRRVDLVLMGAIQQKRTEFLPPYALFADDVGRYFAKQTRAGEYKLTATPYYLNASGQVAAGEALTINFTFVAPGLSVNNLRIVTAPEGQVIQVLEEGDEISLGSQQDINILADPSFPEFNSLEFVLEGPVMRRQLQNAAPYALFGDQNGTLNAAQLPEGNYKLTVTPFLGKNRAGYAGEAVVVNFSVVSDPDDDLIEIAFPVPFFDRLTLKINQIDMANFQVEFVHINSGEVYTIPVGQITLTEDGLQLYVPNLPKGPYTVRIQSMGKTTTLKVTKQ